MKQFEIFGKIVECDETKHYLAYSASFDEKGEECYNVKRVDFYRVLNSINNIWDEKSVLRFFELLERNGNEEYKQKCNDVCINLEEFSGCGEDYMKQGLDNTAEFARYFLDVMKDK